MKDPVPNTDAPDPIEGTPSHGEAPRDAAAEAAAEGDDVTTDDLDDLEELEELDHAGEELDAELLALREEFADLNDRHLRLAAEFNNYRRRVEAERADLWSRAQAETVRKLVDILDDLQRVAGLDLSNATVEAIMEGIDLVDRKFVRMLGELGVEVLEPAGERFDPESMEAMMRVAAEAEEDDERVAQVFQKGYALKGTLIRPARVSVYKHG